jgi:hypothetical protein
MRLNAIKRGTTPPTEADMPRMSFTIAASAAALLLLTATDGRAEYSAYGAGRYCAVFSNGTGSAKEVCNYNDFESCRLEIVSGNRGWCNDNPRWSGVSPGARIKHRYR